MLCDSVDPGATSDQTTERIEMKPERFEVVLAARTRDGANDRLRPALADESREQRRPRAQRADRGPTPQRSGVLEQRRAAAPARRGRPRCACARLARAAARPGEERRRLEEELREERELDAGARGERHLSRSARRSSASATRGCPSGWPATKICRMPCAREHAAVAARRAIAAKAPTGSRRSPAISSTRRTCACDDEVGDEFLERRALGELAHRNVRYGLESGGANGDAASESSGARSGPECGSRRCAFPRASSDRQLRGTHASCQVISTDAVARALRFPVLALDRSLNIALRRRWHRARHAQSWRGRRGR